MRKSVALMLICAVMFIAALPGFSQPGKTFTYSSVSVKMTVYLTETKYVELKMIGTLSGSYKFVGNDGRAVIGFQYDGQCNSDDGLFQCSTSWHGSLIRGIADVGIRFKITYVPEHYTVFKDSKAIMNLKEGDPYVIIPSDLGPVLVKRPDYKK